MKKLGFLKNKTLLIALSIIFLLIAILTVVIIIRRPTQLFPRALDIDVTGSWEMTVNITSPVAQSMVIYTDLVQNADGTVIGTGIDPLTGELTTQTGRVEGNQIYFDDQEITGNAMNIDFVVILGMSGTVSDDSNQMNGEIHGQVIDPMNVQLAGTFVGVRTSGPIPTATPTTAPTGQPTSQPTLPPTGQPTGQPTFQPTLPPTLPPGSTATPIPPAGGGNNVISSTPTPTPTETDTPSNGGDEGNGGPSAPSCDKTSPNAPYLESATPTESVSLKWQKVPENATHYSIEYGPSSGNYPHSVLNTGDVDTYLIGGLSAGCFAVRAWNDCAPSELSNEVCTGQVQGQVLGASTLGAAGGTRETLVNLLFLFGIAITSASIFKLYSLRK